MPFLDLGFAMIGRSALFSMVIVGLLAPSSVALGQAGVGGTEALSPVPAQQGMPDLVQTAKLIVERTNEFRRKQGLQPVGTNPELTDAVRYYGRYLAKTDKFSHTADEKQPGERSKQHGYDYCFVSENIAYEENPAGFTTEELSEKFVEIWKESPEHRKNILDPDVTDTGVAVALSEKTGKYYAVQMFGRPKSRSIDFEIANESDATIQYQIAERKFSLPPRYSRTHQECRSSNVAFLFPGGENAKGQPKTVKPSSGDRFVVVEDQGQLRVDKKNRQASR